MTPEDFLLELAKGNGAIVGSAAAHEIEIADARVTGRWFQVGSLGFILRTKDWRERAEAALREKVTSVPAPSAAPQDDSDKRKTLTWKVTALGHKQIEWNGQRIDVVRTHEVVDAINSVFAAPQEPTTVWRTVYEIVEAHVSQTVRIWWKRDDGTMFSQDVQPVQTGQPADPASLSTRLREIKERCEKATTGPWKVDTENFNGTPDPGLAASIISPDPGGWHVAETWKDFEHEDGDGPDEGEPAGTGLANADFIAHAREDIPFLLAEVERLTQEQRDQLSPQPPSQEPK